jgi:NAD(P)H-dependent FMN reductase
MHIVVVSGSHRKNGQSRKVAAYLAAELARINPAITTDIIDLSGNPLPLWDGESEKPESPTGKVWPAMAERMQKADGWIAVSPEWHGMVPAGLKNFMLHLKAGDVGHKPALITTVSASRGGSYPVNELRTSSYKNARILYLPEHIIVQQVGDVLNGETPANANDEYIRKRITFALRMLLAYVEPMRAVRASGATQDPAYPNGM